MNKGSPFRLSHTLRMWFCAYGGSPPAASGSNFHLPSSPLSVGTAYAPSCPCNFPVDRIHHSVLYSCFRTSFGVQQVLPGAHSRSRTDAVCPPVAVLLQQNCFGLISAGTGMPLDLAVRPGPACAPSQRGEIQASILGGKEAGSFFLFVILAQQYFLCFALGSL